MTTKIETGEENLLEAWIEVETSINGKSIKEALQTIYRELGIRVSHGRLSEWRNYHRSPPPKVTRFMARIVIAEVLSNEGLDAWSLSEEALERIANKLTLPPRAD